MKKNYFSLSSPSRGVSILFIGRLVFLLPLLFLLSLTIEAQKKPLDHSVYDEWQSFGSTALSHDGQWGIYLIKPQEGDAMLYVQKANKKTPLKKIARGARPKITYNSQDAIFLIKPHYKDIKAQRVKRSKGKRNAEKPKDSLGIYNYAQNSLIKIPKVSGFKLPEKNGNYVAFIQEIDQEKKSDSTDSKKKPKTKKQLVLYNLKNNAKQIFDRVENYTFSKNGKYLVYTLKAASKKKDSTDTAVGKEVGVFLVNTQTGNSVQIQPDNGAYSRLTFNEDSDKLAFIGTHDKKKKDVKKYQLFLYDLSNKKLDSLTDKVNGMPEGWVISENRTPQFSKNGKKLFLGIAPHKIPKDTSLIKEDHAVLDIWSYKDDYLQPQQLNNLKRDLRKSYLSVVHLKDFHSLIPLQDKKTNWAQLVDRGDAPFVFEMSDYGHRIEKQWDITGHSSYYIVNTQTGEKTAVLKDLKGNARISPKGNFVVYFDLPEGNWYAYNVKTRETQLLNRELKVSFANERDDHPDYAPPYSLIGWTEEDESVLINDRYDVWEFFLKKKKSPRNVTRNFGRKNKIKFSYLNLDPEQRGISRTQQLIFQGFDEQDKDAGFYTLALNKNKKPRKLLMEPMAGHRSLKKAKDASQYWFQHYSFETPPALVSTKDFKTYTTLAQTNPQQKDYNWGTVELVKYKTLSGKPATGMLFKPEDFDSSKKYPLLLYFYERRSDDLHNYEPPAPTPSRLNITFFVSNHYLVFVPDIEYKIGHPGKSSADYVDGAIDYLKQFDWVNGDKVGIQGQSWGGYEVAYLITQSDRYAAAWTGAPVVNMTSAYGGMRWASGMNRQFQYEKTQSRIGKTLWDGLDLYLENSPLFHLPNVTTPVVIMSNDGDGAVPWYQGIEMFTALKRLRKPAWLLNYNGDAHNLMKRQNRKDIQRREQQFFDYYLKDAKAPVWMTEGIPAVKKGKTWGFELTDDQP